MLVAEMGPFQMFARLRTLAGVSYTLEGEVVAPTVLAELFSCVWCMSRWIAAILTLLTLIMPTIMLWTMMIFAASTVAIFVERWVRDG